MAKDAAAPRQRPNAGAVFLAVVVLLTVAGGVAFYLLGREDPREPASAALGWGDRVERRLDAYIDGHRPEWTDRVEERLDAFVDEVGQKRKQDDGQKKQSTGAAPSPSARDGAGR